MCYVVLRNRKVLKYNDVKSIAHDRSMVSLHNGKDGQFLVAKIPIDIIERVEWGKPCAILKAKPLRKRANY